MRFAPGTIANEITALNRSKLSAISLANDRMEYFRSLPYDEVGTLTGIVRGSVPTASTLTLNGIDFAERVVVQYVDGVGDGIGGSDGNGILTDYKQIKLEYTWDQNGQPETIALVSNIMPRAIESDVGGGSIRVEVYDQDLAPLSGARVELSNASSTAPIYEDRLSNASGQVLFSGVPADSNYELVVSGTIGGVTYSTDQTYEVTTLNQNPVRAPFAVVEDGLATQTFFFD
ncbi:MAG: carboxypeptidase-like regulatory domain-containing protein [Cyanobacteria bacterium P01_D01_bin.115]